MKINLSQIRQSPGTSCSYELAEQLSPVELPGEILTFQGPVKAKLTAVNTGRLIHIQGELQAQVELKCSRCLDPYLHQAEVAFDENYCHAAETQDTEVGEEFKVFEGDILDITSEVVESIIVGLPMKPVCQVDCEGFCPHCGQDLKAAKCLCQDDKLDPRLEILKKLL